MTRLTITFWIGGFLLAMLAGCASAGDSSAPPYPHDALRPGEKLAFTVYRANQSNSPLDLYVMDDTNKIQLVGEISSVVYDVKWSPDGQHLLYTTGLYLPWSYHLADGNGVNQQVLVSENYYEEMSRWSPDSNYLAFLATDRQGQQLKQLRVIEIATGKIQPFPATNVWDFTWLADGQSILCLIQDSDTLRADVFKRDGTFDHHVANLDFLDVAFPILLSPDGQRVAYVQTPEADEDSADLNDPIYVASLDGKDIRRVGGLWMDGAMAWSPDSRQLAFVTQPNDSDHEALWVVKADGSDARELAMLNTGDTSGEILPYPPSWLPDSHRILIGSYLDAGEAFLLVNADGSGQRTITQPGELIHDIRWMP